MRTLRVLAMAVSVGALIFTIFEANAAGRGSQGFGGKSKCVAKSTKKC